MQDRPITNKNTNNKQLKLTEEQEKELEIRKQLTDFILHLEKLGMPTKGASFLNLDKRITYWRGKDLMMVFNQIHDKIRAAMLEICNRDIGENGPNSAQKFYEIFYERRILMKCDKMKDDKLKYPKRLQPVQDVPVFEENKFYWVEIERKTQKRTYFYLGLCIFVVFFACLFPVWPLSVKLFVWWVLFGLLIFMVYIIA
jgi:hypothetical protein